jgi:outer membrane protein TolC
MNRRVVFVIFACALSTSAKPITLHEAYGRLFKNNLDLMVAQTELRKVEAELSETRSAWWPSVDVNGSYLYLSEKSSLKVTLPPPIGEINREIGANDRAEIGLDLSYPLFTGFSRYYTDHINRESVASKKAQLEGAINRITLTLGVLYLQWELSYKQADLRRALVEQLGTYSRQVTAMREAGTALQSKLLEARARLQLARVDLAAAEDQCDSLRRELMSFILCKDEEIVPDSSGTAFDTLPVPKRAIIDTLRPELVMLAHAGEQIDLARRSLKFRHFPTLVGLAGYRVGKPGLAMGSEDYSGYGLVGMQLKWNLFDGLKVRAQQTQYSCRLELVDIERTRQIEALERTFGSAREQLNNAANRLVATEESREAARALAEDLKNTLAAGMVTTADYLNALVNLAGAELMVEQAKTAKKIAMLKMLYAMGKELKY